MLDVAARSGYRLLGRAMAISVAVTAGFVLLFGGVGLIIVAGGRFVVDAMPWVGLAIGALLMALGLWMVAGRRKVYFGLAQRASARIDVRSRSGLLSFFLFGVAYGLASLSCTLPVFLIVVVSSAVASTFIDGMLQFIAYSLGMGLVLAVLTVWTALFKGAMAGYLQAALPYVERAGAILTVLAGAFIVYYWVSIGGLGPDRLQVGFLNKIVEMGLASVTKEASVALVLVPGYAFTAGMLATINPCGFAMLPAYISLYLAGDEAAS